MTEYKYYKYDPPLTLDMLMDMLKVIDNGTSLTPDIITQIQKKALEKIK